MNANEYGFLPENSGSDNVKAMQKMLDMGGSIYVDRPGEYAISNTLYIGSNTTLKFGNGVSIKKVNEGKEFCQCILNKGALTKTYDEHIIIEGLNIIVNGIDNRNVDVFGLIGQVGFHYVKDLQIRDFRCYDLKKLQYGIHICTFEDILVDNVYIEGDKDGVHLGKGKRFTISNCVFKTFDDGLALNGHDYDIGNPELGWIENGLVQNCHDIKADTTVGFFCRCLAGAWVDWYEGMEVQKSDTVVSNGRMYRVKADPDGKMYISKTRPVHEKGEMVLDGITWVMIQNEAVYNAGVRNVTFRDIYLEKSRTGFSLHYDTGVYSRSFYPGAKEEKQTGILFDNIRNLHEGDGVEIFNVVTPVEDMTVINSGKYNGTLNRDLC